MILVIRLCLVFMLARLTTSRVVISAMVVGFSVRGLVKLVGTEQLLYLSAFLLTIGLLMIIRISRVCRDAQMPEQLIQLRPPLAKTLSTIRSRYSGQ